MDTMQTVVAELQKVHGLSERDAASIAMTVSGVAELRLKPKTATASACPFREKENSPRTDEACPICGLTSTATFEDLAAKCVDGR